MKNILLFSILLIVVSVGLYFFIKKPPIVENQSVDKSPVVFDTYSMVDSYFEFDYDSENKLNQHDWDSIFNNKNFEFANKNIEYYFYGNLHFNLWQQYYYAYEFLLSLQNHIYFDPPIDRFYPQIPDESTRLKLSNNQLEQVNTISDGYQKLNSDQCIDLIDKNPVKDELFIIESNDIGKIANPFYIQSIAIQHITKSANHFEKLINLSEALDSIPKSIIRFGLISSYLKKDSQLNEILNHKIIEMMINNLNVENYDLTIEIIELFSVLILNGRYNEDELVSLLKRIQSHNGKHLLLIKIDRLDLAINLDMNLTETISMLMDEGDLIYIPEYYLAIAEQLYENDKIEKSEETINKFWFEIIPDQPPFEWWYTNYRSYLIRSSKIGIWDGKYLPEWLASYLDIFNNHTKLKGLNHTFKLFVNLITGHVSGVKRYN